MLRVAENSGRLATETAFQVLARAAEIEAGGRGVINLGIGQPDFKTAPHVVEAAVKRMLPKESPLARKQFSKLRVYAGAEHPHEAQQPEVVDFKSMNSKNARS